eukprot:2688458-Prymnesium_polylepis.1
MSCETSSPTMMACAQTRSGSGSGSSSPSMNSAAALSSAAPSSAAALSLAALSSAALSSAALSSTALSTALASESSSIARSTSSLRRASMHNELVVAAETVASIVRPYTLILRATTGAVLIPSRTRSGAGVSCENDGAGMVSARGERLPRSNFSERFACEWEVSPASGAARQPPGRRCPGLTGSDA